MIADWTVEVGPDSPWIVVPWEGWVDLRAGLDVCDRAESSSSRLETLPEVRQFPELLRPMVLINRLHCFTSKVDVFPVTREDADPEIAEAGERETAHGLGSYLDVLTDRFDVFPEFAQFERLAKTLAGALRKCKGFPLTAAEIVVRPAHMRLGQPRDVNTFGWTLYVMGFGETKEQARERWAKAYGLLICYMGLHVCFAVHEHCENVSRTRDAENAATGE